MMMSTELSLTDDIAGAGMCLKNPVLNEKGVMLVLGNNQLAFAKGRSPTEIGKNEVTCTIKPSGKTAILKHIAKKGVFTVNARNSGQVVLFRPGVEGNNLEFCMLRNPEDEYSFCLYLETPDPSCRLCVMPDSTTSDSGLMTLELCRADDKHCFVFGSTIIVKFTK